MSKPDRHQDRASVDLLNLRSRILAFRNDAAWKEMSLSSKIRELIRIALNQSPNSTTIADLVRLHWSAICESEIDLTLKRLKELQRGDRPTDCELVELATVLPTDTHQLMEIRHKTFGESNGTTSDLPTGAGRV